MAKSARRSWDGSLSGAELQQLSPAVRRAIKRARDEQVAFEREALRDMGCQHSSLWEDDYGL